MNDQELILVSQLIQEETSLPVAAYIRRISARQERRLLGNPKPASEPEDGLLFDLKTGEYK